MSASITIGCQGGGPETAPVGRAKVNLYHALARHVTSTHCDAIDEYGLVLRVDGSLDKFGPEGITRLRFAKKQRYITVDIQMPESVWTPLGDLELRQYLGAQVSEAVRVCVARLKKDGHVVDDAELMHEVDAAVSEYTQESKTANKTSLLTPDPPQVPAAMITTTSTPCSTLAPGQAWEDSTFGVNAP